MGLFRGAVFHHGGVPGNCPISTTGVFALLNGPFSDLPSRKPPGKQPIKKRVIKRFLKINRKVNSGKVLTCNNLGVDGERQKRQGGKGTGAHANMLDTVEAA